MKKRLSQAQRELQEVENKIKSGYRVRPLIVYANINDLVTPVLIAKLQEYPEFATPIFDLDKFCGRHGLLLEGHKQIDQSLFDEIRGLHHGNSGKPTRTSGTNGLMAKKLIRTILTTIGLKVLKRENHYGFGDYNEPLKWDLIAIADEVQVILVIESKLQSGGGSAERKWHSALMDILAFARGKPFSREDLGFGPLDSSPQ
jgi:hypothetical protein